MTLSLLLAAVLPAAAQTVPPYRFASAVQTALVAMGDGNEAGTVLADAVRETGAAVVSEDIPTPTALRLGPDGRPVIVVSPKVALAPRALAPHLAREAAKLALRDMPECAEKHYMMRSLMARAWLELGGEPAALPVVDPLTGAADPSLAAEIREWIEVDAQTLLARLGDANGTADLPTLSSAASAGAERARLAEADRRFLDFMRAEREWELSRALPR